MKRIHNWILFTALFCSTSFFTSCGPEGKDNPVSDTYLEALANREQLLTDISRDASTFDSQFNCESFNAASQAYAQLLSLIQRDKTFITTLKALFTAASEKQSLVNITPVEPFSELAKKGYLAYLTIDNGSLGLRVVLDGKGGCRLLSSDNLEFIFPANVEGIGSTLFKVVVKPGDDYYQSVSDAKIPNLKGLACVARLSKSLSLKLSAFIDNQEMVLSENVIRLELPETPNSDFVSFDAASFKIVGTQSAYLKGKDDNQLDYSLSMEGNKMLLTYDFTSNGTRLVSFDAQLAFPQKADFTSQMVNGAYSISDLQALTIRLVDDLTFQGTIDDGAAFARAYARSIQNRLRTSSAEALLADVESLNNSCRLQLSSAQMKSSEPVRFCLVQEDNAYTLEPGLKNLTTQEYLPISHYVDAQTLAAINKPFQQSFVPVGNSADSILKFYSVLIQMSLDY